MGKSGAEHAQDGDSGTDDGGEDHTGLREHSAGDRDRRPWSSRRRRPRAASSRLVRRAYGLPYSPNPNVTLSVRTLVMRNCTSGATNQVLSGLQSRMPTPTPGSANNPRLEVRVTVW